MSYIVDFTDDSKAELQKLKRSEPKTYQKALTLIRELSQTPMTGTGRPKPLRGDKAGLWSRRISDKHRLVYRIIDQEVCVLVLQAYGHYDDK